MVRKHSTYRRSAITRRSVHAQARSTRSRTRSTHHHRGHPESAATRKKISEGLKRYYRNHPRRHTSRKRRKHDSRYVYGWGPSPHHKILRAKKPKRVRHPRIRHPRVRHPHNQRAFHRANRKPVLRYKPPKARLKRLPVHVRRPRSGSLQQMIVSRYRGRVKPKLPTIL